MKKENTKIAKTNKKETKVVDAKDRTLGRVASEVASFLMGKNSASYERHKYSGFPVEVMNASKIKITAKKLEQSYHARYSGYPGGLTITKGKETVAKKGMKELVRLAVYDMLPGNKLRREMMKNLTIHE